MRLTIFTKKCETESMDELATQSNDLYKNSKNIADKLQLFANGNRLRILCHLASGPLSVNEMVECLDLSQSAISQHLAKLKDSRIVSYKKDAQTSYYYIQDEETFLLMSNLHKTFCP